MHSHSRVNDPSSSPITVADMATWTQVCIPVPTAKGIEEMISQLHSYGWVFLSRRHADQCHSEARLTWVS